MKPSAANSHTRKVGQTIVFCRLSTRWTHGPVALAPQSVSHTCPQAGRGRPARARGPAPPSSIPHPGVQLQRFLQAPPLRKASSQELAGKTGFTPTAAARAFSAASVFPPRPTPATASALRLSPLWFWPSLHYLNVLSDSVVNALPQPTLLPAGGARSPFGCGFSRPAFVVNSLAPGLALPFEATS
jgi:hypothetical protein